MAKLLDVAKEITAEAHRLDWLLGPGFSLRDKEAYRFELYDVLNSLIDDLESVNLPKLVEKLNRRGELIQREQDRRHQNNIRKAHKIVINGESSKAKLYQIKKLFHDNKVTHELTDKELCFIIKGVLGLNGCAEE